jgi:hypothetical protein
MSDKDNIVNFPSNELEHEEHELHKCDSCTSAYIHELTVKHFEDIQDDEIIGECLGRIFEVLDDDGDQEEIVDAVAKMFWEAFDQGYKQKAKNLIHTLSSELHMLSAETDGEEQ